MSRKSRVLSLILGIVMILGMLPLSAFAAGEGGFENFTKQRSFSETTFSDVKAEDWFYDNVKAAYELGFMVGTSSGAFDPEGDLTIAQAVTVAARIHSIYTAGADSFAHTEPWYKAYADYAKEKGIIAADYPDYSKKATRAEFAAILAGALPEEALSGINNVEDNAIPDVAMGDANAEAIYFLYRAGIFAGNDAKGTFAPESNISRSEVSAVVSRMADPELRKTIELSAADAEAAWAPVFDSETLTESGGTSEIDEILRNVRIGYADGDKAECVTKDVTLPTEVTVEGLKGSFAVKWYSNNTSAIQNSGRVKRGTGTVDVTLTAKVTYKGESGTKDFDLTVIKENRDVPVLCDNIEDLAQFSEDGSVPSLYINESGIISNIDGVISNVEVNSCDDAIKALESVKNILEIGDPEAEFIGLTSNISNYVNSYVLQQVYNGIPVSYRTVTVSTTKDGVADFVNNSYLPGISISTVPELSAEEARDRLSKDYSGEYTYEERGLAVDTLGEHEKAPALVYVFSACTDGYVVETLYVDASTGEVLYAEPAARYNIFKSVGLGNDELGKEQYFPIAFDNSKKQYRMQDISRDILVYNYNTNTENNNKIPEPNDIFKSDTYKFIDSTQNIGYYSTAISAYINLIKTYDWYIDTIGYNPVAEQGQIKIYIHSNYKINENTSIKYDNALCCKENNTCSFYFFDNSIGSTPTYAACLDVAAHEYTHGVLYRLTGGIPYLNATGAIDEGYADIVGCIVKGCLQKDLKDDQIWSYADRVSNTHLEHRDIAKLIDYHGEDKRYLPSVFDTSSPNFVPFVKPKNANQDNDYGGVHTNHTIISHTAYEMYKNGIPLEVLARLWYESMVLGYNNDSNFYNVRLNVLKAAQTMQLSDNQIKIIKTAFEKANIIPEYKICGKITISDDDTDLTNNFPLEGASVSLTGIEFREETTTDKNGSYSFSKIPEGTYTLTVSAEGYVTIKQSVIATDNSNTYCDLSIETIVEEQFGDGTASGRIIGNGNAKGVEGLKLIIRRGLNNTTKVYDDELTLTTDQDGKYTTPMLRQGEYTVQIIDDREYNDKGELIKDDERYAPLSFNIKIVSNESVTVPDMRVTNNTNSDEILVVLSWGNAPSGLTAHYYGPYHYDWSYNESGDKSYRSSFITFPKQYDGEYGGAYVYAVYCNASQPLACSGAQVNVYRGNEHILTFNVPAKEGVLWKVFSYYRNTKEFFVINEMSDEVGLISDDP